MYTVVVNLFTKIYRIVIDALFPLSQEEEELLTLLPEQALNTLPPAPAYDASVLISAGDARSVFGMGIT